MRTVTRLDVLMGTAVALFLLGSSFAGLLAVSQTEILGFLTGGLSDAGFLALCVLGVAGWRRQLEPGALRATADRLREAA
jgi:hypothetical protein